MKKPQRILVIRGGALGDFVVSLPVLAALRGAYPKAHLGVLCHRAHGRLLEVANCVDEWRDLEARDWVGLFVDEPLRESGSNAWLSGFDLIVSFLHDATGVVHRHINQLSGGQLLIGCARPPNGACRPASEMMLEALEPLDLKHCDPVPQLQFDFENEGAKILALHPGSGSELKNWPEAKWEQLIGRLSEEGERLLLIGGESEADRVGRLADQFASENVRAMINRPLPEVAQTLAGCRGMVGHDSGVSHLSAALNVPCVLMWGATDEEVWRPAGNGVSILRGTNGISSIEVGAVLDEIKKCLPSIDS